MKSMAAILLAGLLFSSVTLADEPTSQPAQTTSAPAVNIPKTIQRQYPHIASGCLLHAQSATLPDGVLLRCGEIRVTQDELEAEVAKAERSMQEQLRKNGFFLLEQIATQRLLLAEAHAALTSVRADVASMSSVQTIKTYLDRLATDVTVTDGELRAFYDQNRDMVGDVTFEQVRQPLRQYLVGQKRQDFVSRHVATLGQRRRIEVNAAWTMQQAKTMADNPVDRARDSGRPSLVDFGADGCRPCDMMTPILETLRAKYQGRVNVEFVHVREEQVLASRYGIRSIPVQVFFDAKGNEMFRHSGFYPQDQIERRLAEMGVK